MGVALVTAIANQQLGQTKFEVLLKLVCGSLPPSRRSLPQCPQSPDRQGHLGRRGHRPLRRRPHPLEVHALAGQPAPAIAWTLLIVVRDAARCVAMCNAERLISG